MPIIKSAIKRMKQNRVRRVRSKHYGSHMKSMIKLMLTHVEKGEMDKAKKLLPDVISAIDTAAKKKIIHEKNAAHKKSRVQKALNVGPQKKNEKKPAEKVEAPVEEKVEAPVEDKPLDEKAELSEAEKVDEKK